MKLAFFIFSFLIFIPEISKAQSTTNEASLNFETSALVKALEAQLQSQIKTLKRTIQVYHYGTRGNSNYVHATNNQNFPEVMNLKDDQGTFHGPVPLYPQEAKNYFQALSRSFEQGTIDWTVGHGFYAALDPVQSFGYLGYPGFLMQVTVPIQTQYLDAREFNIRSSSQVFDGSSAFFELIRQPWARKVINEFLEKNKIGLIAYQWGEGRVTGLDFCREVSSDATAFIFVRPEMAEQLGFTVFGQQLEAKPDPQKKDKYLKIFKLILARQWSDPRYFKFPEVIKQKNQQNSLQAIHDRLSSRLESWKALLPAKPELLFSPDSQEVLIEEARNETFQCSEKSNAKEDLKIYQKQEAFLELPPPPRENSSEPRK